MRTIFVAVLVLAAVAAARPLKDNGEHDWKACETIPVLGDVCGVVYVDPDLLEVGVKVEINNHTVFDKHWEGGNVCADEKELLKLLELIPGLAPYKPIIDEIIKIWGHLPAEVFSVCIELYNESWHGSQFSACAKLDLKIICWKGSCVHKGVHELGCFTI